MKQIIISFAALAAALIMISSCTEKEQNYSFGTVYSTNISDTASLAPVREFFLSYDYFKDNQYYWNTFSEACVEAYADFVDACGKIDEEELCALIPAEGQGGSTGAIVLYLISNDSGEIIAYSKTYQSTQKVDEEAEEEE